jgi:hypothetical protein
MLMQSKSAKVLKREEERAPPNDRQRGKLRSSLKKEETKAPTIKRPPPPSHLK